MIGHIAIFLEMENLFEHISNNCKIKCLNDMKNRMFKELFSLVIVIVRNSFDNYSLLIKLS